MNQSKPETRKRERATSTDAFSFQSSAFCLTMPFNLHDYGKQSEEFQQRQPSLSTGRSARPEGPYEKTFFNPHSGGCSGDLDRLLLFLFRPVRLVGLQFEGGHQPRSKRR